MFTRVTFVGYHRYRGPPQFPRGCASGSCCSPCVQADDAGKRLRPHCRSVERTSSWPPWSARGGVMSRRYVAVAAGVSIGLLGIGTVPSAIAAAQKAPVKHVLLLSFDGLHESDLAY